MKGTIIAYVCYPLVIFFVHVNNPLRFSVIYNALSFVVNFLVFMLEIFFRKFLTFVGHLFGLIHFSCNLSNF